MSVTGVVTALSSEARALGPATRRADGLAALGDGVLVAVGGMGCPAAGRAARALLDAGVSALVSWGLAGGLDPSLSAGTICLPSLVVSGEGARFPTDPAWRGILSAALGPTHLVVNGKLLTSACSIDSVDGKAAAYRASGAAAVDMESVSIAQVAAVRSLPFIAVRVIADTAVDALPRAVVSASREGTVRISRLLIGIASSPKDIVPLVRLALRYRAALRSLMAVARTGSLAFAAGAPGRLA